MGVMPFRHARISVPELCRDDTHRNASHSKRAAIGVPQNVERCGWIELRSRGGFFKRALLMGRSPSLSVLASEDPITWGSADSQGRKQPLAISVQCDVPGLTGLGVAHRDGARVCVEVGSLHSAQLAIAAP